MNDISKERQESVSGSANVIYKDDVIGKYNLLAFEDIKRVNIFTRLIRSINYLIWGDV